MKKWLALFVLTFFSDFAIATLILVSDYSANQVTAYELATGEQLSSPFPITGLSSPLGLATNPGKTLLYVANQNGGKNIDIYDLSTGQKLTTLLSDLPSPSGIALNSDGTVLYVANFGGFAEAYNAMTGTSIQTYSAGISGCSDVTLSPDGTILYVSNFNGHNVTIYDAETGAALGFSPITLNIEAASAIALSADGSTLYVCSVSNNRINTYNALTGEIIADPFLDSGSGLNAPYGMRLNEDETALYV